MHITLTPGQRILERFELLEPVIPTLTVWCATDLKDTCCRLIAIRGAGDRDADQLCRAMRLFGDVSLPGIVPVSEFISGAEWSILVFGDQELQVQKLNEPLSYNELLRRCSDLLRSLRTVHERGLVHGCIDNAHLLCTSGGGYSLLPPTTQTLANDDIVCLGNVFLSLLTANRAPDDVTEPNHCPELLHQGRRVPALVNEVLAAMIAGKTAGMRDVVRRFDEIRGDSENLTRRAETVDIAEDHEDETSRPSRLRFRVTAVLAMLIAAMCALLWVSHIAFQNPERVITPSALPTTGISEGEASDHLRSESSQSLAMTPSHSRTMPAKKETDTTTLETTDDSDQRNAAESALDRWLASYRDLERVGGDQWGGEAFERVDILAKNADDEFLAKNYQKAQQFYLSAASSANLLYQSRGEKLQELSDVGMSALESGEADVAAAAFGHALGIEPTNRRARIGHERARTVNEVTQLIQKAIVAELGGHLGMARALFQDAAALDRFSSEAVSGLRRVNEAITEDGLNNLISDSLKAIGAGALETAQKALDDAVALNSDSPALIEVRKILDTASDTEAVSTVEMEAKTAKQREDWQKVRQFYLRIIEIIPESKMGQEGRMNAELMIRLQTELADYIENPNQLRRDDRRFSARVLVEMIDKLPEPSPKIKMSAGKLRELINELEVPIVVTLLSDGATDVAIHKVGMLGVFRTHTLALRPGAYTITGQRHGYRDVRNILTIEPGEKTVELTVECRESVF